MAYTIEQLTKAGGKEWQKDTMHRVYFNDLQTRIGLKLDHYNTGNISSAKLDGQEISNSAARKLCDALAFGKVWYDLTDGRFYTKGLRDDHAEKILSQIGSELDA